MYNPFALPNEPSQDAVFHDSHDKRVFAESREHMEDLNAISGHEHLAGAESLARNAFMSFYKSVPTLREDEDLTFTSRIHKKIIGEVMGTNEYHRIRAAGSQNDQWSSAIAATGMLLRITEQLDKQTAQKMRKLQQLEEKAQKMQQNAKQVQSMAQQAKDQDADQDTQQLLEKSAQQTQQSAQQAQQQAQALFQELDAQSQAIEDSARRAGRQGLSEAQEQIEDAEAALDLLDPGQAQGTGQFQRRHIQEKLQVAEALKKNKKLAKIMRLAGNMRASALQKQKQTLPELKEEIVSITTGNNLADVIPSERIFATQPGLRAVFYNKYVHNNLLQYEKSGEEAAEEGAIVVVTDDSISMTGSLTQHGDRSLTKEIWSKAVVVGGLLPIAQQQKRDLAWVHFGTDGDLKVFEFPKGQYTMDQLIEATEFFFSSLGTSFQEWMEAAPALASRDEKNKGDVIVITDGLADIPRGVMEAYWKAKKEKKISTYGVFLASDPLEERQGRAVMETVVDKDPQSNEPHIVSMADMADESKALDMMFSI